NVDEQAALVLAGDESAGDLRKAEARQSDQADVDHEHDGAEAKAPSHGLAVGVSRPVEAPVKAAEKPSQGPVDGPDNEQAKHAADEGAGKEEDEVNFHRADGGQKAVGGSGR